jgi:magnesium-transporting ATPase (P-type)
MILYFFYKNFVFTLIQYFFSFFTLSSGQTIIDDWYITCYNLIFTAFPLCISAITDTDIDINDQREKKKNFALLYKENRDKYRVFSFGQFMLKLIKAIVISLIIFSLSGAEEILYKGRTQNIWILSLKNYISTLIIVSANLLINTNYIVLYLPLSIGITTFLLFIIFLIFNHYGLLFEFNSKASIFPSLSSPLLYLTVIFVSCFSFVFDYSFKMIDLFINNSLSSKLLISEAIKSKRKSSIGISKVHSSKPYPQILSTRKRNSVQISRNFLLYKMPHFFNQNNDQYNQNQNATPKQRYLHRFQSSKIMNQE